MRPLDLDFFFFGTAIANSAFVNSELTEKFGYKNEQKDYLELARFTQLSLVFIGF